MVSKKISTGITLTVWFIKFVRVLISGGTECENFIKLTRQVQSKDDFLTEH